MHGILYHSDIFTDISAFNVPSLVCIDYFK